MTFDELNNKPESVEVHEIKKKLDNGGYLRENYDSNYSQFNRMLKDIRLLVRKLD